MVIEYLEKIREYFQNQKVDIVAEIQSLKNRLKENTEIKKVLEENNDPYFEVFTPRTVNGFNKRKIDELNIENKKIENTISTLVIKLEDIDNEIDKVNLVIKTAKEKEQLLNSLKY